MFAKLDGAPRRSRKGDMTMKKLILPVLVLALGACHGSSSHPSDHVQVAITERGFEPANVHVPAGKPVTIVFDRKTDRTCAKALVIPMPDGTKIEKKLPLDTPVEVATTFPTAGKLTYACAMDMMKGTITVQ
jgi:plastocyanin domain-containing protein